MKEAARGQEVVATLRVGTTSHVLPGLDLTLARQRIRTETASWQSGQVTAPWGYKPLIVPDRFPTTAFFKVRTLFGEFVQIFKQVVICVICRQARSNYSHLADSLPRLPIWTGLFATPFWPARVLKLCHICFESRHFLMAIVFNVIDRSLLADHPLTVCPTRSSQYNARRSNLRTCASSRATAFLLSGNHVNLGA